MRRQARREQRLRDEQEPLSTQRAERRELDFTASQKKLENNALRALDRHDRTAPARTPTPRRQRPGKPPKR